MSQATVSTKTYTLSSGHKMPAIGLGTKKGDDREQTIRIIQDAIESGYRHIDTAAMYETEDMVGEAIRRSGVKREDLFVTSKVWCTDLIKERVLPAFEKSLATLNVDYIDLYLIHWPIAFESPQSSPPKVIENYDFVETWKELEKLVESGKVKSIGVSNFNIEKLERLLKHCKIPPTVNQVELHPYLAQPDLKKFCDENKIILTGYSPLGRSIEPRIDQDKVIVELADKYQVSSAQIILSWAVQRGTAVVPRSANKERQLKNITLVQLDEDDKKKVDDLNKNHRYINPEKMWGVKNVF
ncbi:Aldo/keto reductase YtbE [Neoconidiobolus thromboides FSU 785]|nr:Aldo/keto reductase YtbE [Neoconidiobolus thromboides FSU 785]